jgi:predicted DNA-binding protein (MmcQ/YjbR family)
MAKRNPLARAEAELRQCALAYPESVEEFPWGHRAVKVKGKIFVTIGVTDGVLGVTVKLPLSGRVALLMPFAEPTHYGMGKHGWVTARFAAGDEVPVEMLREWIDESFRAVAPKKLVARLDAEQ